MGKSRQTEQRTTAKNSQKVVLATGATSDLGKATAELFVSRGYKVYAGARDASKLSSGAFTPLKLDITKEADCQNAVDTIWEKEGKLDVLVNVAGMTLAGPTTEFTVEEYERLLSVNAVGTFRLIKAVVPVMKRRKYGRIINITSLNGLLSFPNYGVYSSSKFALEALGEALYYELARYGISVTNIAPGAIKRNGEETSKLNSPYRPAREKFLILKLLMPMLTAEKVSEKIVSVAESENPPLRVILGADARITTFFKKFSVFSIWERIMLFVWNKK